MLGRVVRESIQKNSTSEYQPVLGFLTFLKVYPLSICFLTLDRLNVPTCSLTLFESVVRKLPSTDHWPWLTITVHSPPHFQLFNRVTLHCKKGTHYWSGSGVCYILKHKKARDWINNKNPFDKRCNLPRPDGYQDRKPERKARQNNLDKLHRLNKGEERAKVKMERTVKNQVIKRNWTKVSKKINKVLFSTFLQNT